MASGRIKLIAAAAIVAAGTGGYFLYSVFAAQAQGELAQAPLNVETQVAPALIMALDDSGSMLWETLNNTRDGVFAWQDNGSNTGSFYNGSGPRGYNGGSQNFHYVIPAYGRDGNFAIPPLDAFGFARSPDVNPGYFDPRIDYPTWKNADGSDYRTVDATAAPLDPRPTAAPSHIAGALNLTTNAESTVNSWRFRVRPGMRLPQNTRVRGSCNAQPTNISNNDYAPLPDARRITQTCDLHISYFPATFFLTDPSALPASYGYSASPVAVTDPPGGRPGTLYRYEIKLANFATAAQYNAAIQNFANWFSFYRTRREALIGGATNSLVDVENMRVGWFRIHNRVDVTMRDMSDSDAKQTLFTEIISQMRASSSTPTRRAVRHIGEQFKRTGNNAPVKLSCQKNAGMLFTDGYINEEGNSPSPGNLDQPYGAPFSDDVSSTMADIVIPYYYESLVPALEQNAVTVPAACSGVPAPPALPPDDLRYLDCQTNLHMNFYGVALGTQGVQFGVDYDSDPDNPLKVLPDPYLNPPSWNDSREDLSPIAVDEMWHATLNSRGAMINAKTPADITRAMRSILEAVSSGGSSSGSLAMTGARIGARTLAVVPGYSVKNEGTDWSSTLDVFKVTADLTTGVVSDTTLWEGAAKLAALPPSTRSTQTWVGTSAGTSLLSAITDLDAFCDNPRPGMSRCSEAEIAALGVNASQSIDYFLGDSSREVRNGGALRDRTTVLGDIINSTPVVSAPTDDYGYRSLPAPYGASYDTYMTTKQARPAMVYVGANDGMLHAFHGGINYLGTVDAANAGVEQFAYIPRAVLGHMGNLLFPYDPDAVGQKFDHRYYVDGPITTGDAYYGGGWKTVLVGTTGAGGRSVFALNVSNPSSFNRLWEIDDQHATPAVRNSIGHVLGKPVIVPFRTAAGGVSWKAIFGNGYNSTNGRAVLFVVDIDDGTVRMIEAVETGAPPGSNGLGNIVVVDRRDTESGFAVQDGFADTVYAADQKGAIWKFDLLAAATSISAPLFTTQTHVEDGVTYRQPVIGGLTATAGRSGGVMLMFGTGSFSFNGDGGDNSIQSIYGVQDTGGSVTLTVADLFGRSIVVDGDTTRTITASNMGYGRSGWYLNLPAGERVVGYPRVASGVLFIPAYAPTAADGCSTGGENWLYGLDTRTGAPGLAGVRFDSITGDTQGSGVGAVKVETGGSAPVKDVGVSVLSTSKPIDPDVPRCWMRVSVAGMTESMFVPYPCGRQSWRQLQ